MQNQTYVNNGGKKNNRTVAEARVAERKLKILGMPVLGILAFGDAGQQVELADFEANGIDPDLPARLKLRTSFGNGPDVGQEENSIADRGEFVEVDKVLDVLENPDIPPAMAINRLLSQFEPGLSDSQVQRRLLALPGVQDAFNAAVVAAFREA